MVSRRGIADLQAHNALQCAAFWAWRSAELHHRTTRRITSFVTRLLWRKAETVERIVSVSVWERVIMRLEAILLFFNQFTLWQKPKWNGIHINKSINRPNKKGEKKDKKTGLVCSEPNAYFSVSQIILTVSPKGMKPPIWTLILLLIINNRLYYYYCSLLD